MGVLRENDVNHGWPRKRTFEECDMALAMSRRATYFLLEAAAAYAPLRESEQARRLLQEVVKSWKPDGASLFWMAFARAALGDKDAALECLEKAYEKRASFLVHLKVFPQFNDLHRDPRFDDLVKRIGIPD